MKKIWLLIALMILAHPAYAAVSFNNLRVANTASQGTTQISTTSQPFSEAIICGNSANTGIMVVGGSGVVAAVGTRTGVSLTAGSCTSFKCDKYDECGDLNELYIGSTVSGDATNIMYVQTTLGA
jgi:hypothetical protein